ncbi:MAG: Rieske (2Fe-2S) protein [Bacteroidales bacterium]|nr:Rieske (2Fe-2S) protein [Bacteroidales bacterium]
MTYIFNKKTFSRRSFIKKVLAFIFSIELFYVLFKLTDKKEKSSKPEKLFNAGKVNAFEKNKMYPFTSGHFYLSRFEDGGFLAISTKCTHLGCVVQANTEAGGFICPCHSSKFNKRGEVLSPPATRALDMFDISIENGILKVDIEHPVKRKLFNKNQLSYA